MFRTPKAEVKRFDPEVEAEYEALGERKQGLQASLRNTEGEIDRLITGLGPLVGSGKPFEKQTDKLAKLRQKSEALELGALHIDGQIGLLKRMHTWLRTQ